MTGKFCSPTGTAGIATPNAIVALRAKTLPMMLCCIKWVSAGAPDHRIDPVLGASCIEVARCEKFPGDCVPGQTDRLLKLRFRSSQRPLIHHRVQGLTQLGAILQLPPCAFLGRQSFAGRCGVIFLRPRW